MQLGEKNFFFYLFCLFCSTYSFINKRREKKTLSNFCLLQCNKIKNKKKKKEEKILVFSRNSFSLRTSSRLFTPGKLTRLLLLYFTWWRLILFFFFVFFRLILNFWDYLCLDFILFCLILKKWKRLTEENE